MKKKILLVALLIVFSLGGKNVALGGELIDKHNWEKVKDTFLSTRLLEDVKKGIYTINIVPITPMNVPKWFDELTRKNAGLVKLTPKGHLPNDQYKGGCPFPQIDPNDPQAGAKIMWNYNWRFQGDDYTLAANRFCFDKANRKLDAGICHAIMRAVGRGKIPPIPSIPGDEHLEIYNMVIITHPRDAAGTVTLTVRPNDPDKYDDMFRFFPSVRRVRRLPSTERYASLPPTINIVDDLLGWSGKITHFTYKLLGEQKVLTAKCPPPPYKYKWRPGYPFPVDLDFELRDCWVVEQTPRMDIYPKYAYGKRIFYMDKESWFFNYIKIYDRKGEYWKEMTSVFTTETKTDEGETVMTLLGNYGCNDLQTGHTFTAEATSTGHDLGYNREDFGINKLLEVSRMGRLRAK